MTNAPPSRNQALDGTLTGLVSILRQKILQNTDDMLPAQVVAYDREKNRATLQPLIVVVNTLGEQIPRPQIASVPVLQIGGGGFVISFPISPGDLGWVKANDRDISLFKSSYEQSPPNTQRKHSFSDAVFIPDSFMKDVTIADEDSANLVIQNLDGTVKISWFDNQIKITASTVIIDATDTTVTGTLTVNGITTLKDNVTAQKDLAVDDSITVTNGVTINGIPFGSHRHTGVMTGGGDTGGPIS